MHLSIFSQARCKRDVELLPEALMEPYERGAPVGTRPARSTASGGDDGKQTAGALVPSPSRAVPLAGMWRAKKKKEKSSRERSGEKHLPGQAASCRPRGCVAHGSGFTRRKTVAASARGVQGGGGVSFPTDGRAIRPRFRMGPAQERPDVRGQKQLRSFQTDVIWEKQDGRSASRRQRGVQVGNEQRAPAGIDCATSAMHKT